MDMRNGRSTNKKDWNDEEWYWIDSQNLTIEVFVGIGIFMSRNMIADSQMNTKNIITTLIGFTRTGFSMF